MSRKVEVADDEEVVTKDALDVSLRVIGAARAVANDSPAKPQTFTTCVQATLLKELRDALKAWDELS